MPKSQYNKAFCDRNTSSVLEIISRLSGFAMLRIQQGTATLGCSSILSTHFSFQGVFYRTMTSPGYTAEQRIYAHRSRTRILVNEFTVQRLEAADGQDIEVSLSHNSGPPSDDFDVITVDYDEDTL